MSDTKHTWEGETIGVPELGWQADLSWARDGGMSTYDDQYWIYGDTPQYSPRILPTGSFVRFVSGSTYSYRGKEMGQFPFVLPTGGYRRWPSGVLTVDGDPLVTYTRVDSGGAANGWGWSHKGVDHFSTETSDWGSPYFDSNGDVWVHRRTAGFVGSDPYGAPNFVNVIKKLTDPDGAWNLMPGNLPWGTGVHIQYGPRRSYAVVQAFSTYTVYMSLDFVTWVAVSPVSVDLSSQSSSPGTMHCHQQPWGVLLTWYDNSPSNLPIAHLYEHEYPVPQNFSGAYDDPSIPYDTTLFPYDILSSSAIKTEVGVGRDLVKTRDGLADYYVKSKDGVQ